jgi:hypothetical protein
MTKSYTGNDISLPVIARLTKPVEAISVRLLRTEIATHLSGARNDKTKRLRITGGEGLTMTYESNAAIIILCWLPSSV